MGLGGVFCGLVLVLGGGEPKAFRKLSAAELQPPRSTHMYLVNTFQAFATHQDCVKG